MKQQFNPVQTSPYGIRYKIASRIWGIINSTIYRWSPFFMRKYRVALVRLFGGNIDWSCSLDSTATIIDPWNLTMGKRSSLGENCCIRCRDKVKIGEMTCIGKDVYIMTASHDISSPRFNMITAPVYIGDCVWIATRAMIMKGIKIGDGAVIAAGAIATKDVNEWTIVGGSPAKFISNRVLK